MSWYTKYYTIGGTIKDKDDLEELIRITSASDVLVCILRKEHFEYDAEADDADTDCIEDYVPDWVKNVENTDTENSWIEWNIKGKKGLANDDDNCRMTKDGLLRLVDESKALHGRPESEALLHLNNEDEPLLMHWARAVSNGSKTPELDALRAILDQRAYAEPKVPWDTLKPLDVSPKLMAWLREEYADDVEVIEKDLAKEAEERAKMIKESKESKESNVSKTIKKAKK